MVKHYLWNIFVNISQTLNVITGGEPDETLCSRAWRQHLIGKRWAIVFVPVINKIFFWDANHCKESWENEIAQQHLSLVMKKAIDVMHGHS